MKALTYDGVGKIKVVDKDKPKIEQPAQAIVKLIRTTICGTVRILEAHSREMALADLTRHLGSSHYQRRRSNR